jgi:hypothetical protein
MSAYREGADPIEELHKEQKSITARMNILEAELRRERSRRRIEGLSDRLVMPVRYFSGGGAVYIALGMLTATHCDEHNNPHVVAQELHPWHPLIFLFLVMVGLFIWSMLCSTKR